MSIQQQKLLFQSIIDFNIIQESLSQVNSLNYLIERTSNSMKQAIKKTKRDPIIIDFQTLVEEVKKSYNQNKLQYDQIISLNPQFQFKLFQPIIPSYQTREQLGQAKQQLVSLFDHLTDQSQKLILELNRLHIKVKQQEDKKQKQIMLSMDNFTFLRKQWEQEELQTSAISKVQHLIHNIGVIKGNLLNVIKKQSKLTTSPPDIHQLIISSPEYCQLLKTHQQLKSSYHQLQSVYEKQKLTNSNHIHSQNNNIQNRKNQDQPKQYLEQIKHTTSLELDHIKQVIDHQKENDKYQNNKNVIYKIISSDKTYNIYIEELNRKDTELNLHQIETVKQLTTKQTLQSILKFLQSQSSRKNIRGNQSPSEQPKSRKYTVEEIARPKFISNFVIHHHKPVEPMSSSVE